MRVAFFEARRLFRPDGYRSRDSTAGFSLEHRSARTRGGFESRSRSTWRACPAPSTAARGRLRAEPRRHRLTGLRRRRAQPARRSLDGDPRRGRQTDLEVSRRSGLDQARQDHRHGHRPGRMPSAAATRLGLELVTVIDRTVFGFHFAPLPRRLLPSALTSARPRARVRRGAEAMNRLRFPGGRRRTGVERGPLTACCAHPPVAPSSTPSGYELLDRLGVRRNAVTSSSFAVAAFRSAFL